MGLHYNDPERPCQFFDGPTLEYYITTNRDGLKLAAEDEWKFRWGTHYPQKGKDDETAYIL